MKKYETLIFDLDDTLINYDISAKFAFKQTVQKIGIPYSDELMKKWLEFEKNYWIIFERDPSKFLKEETYIKDKIEYVRAKRFFLFFKSLNLSIQDSIKINEYYCCMLGEKIIQIEGAEETLKELSTRYEIVIATNGPKNAANSKVKKANLNAYVSEIISSEEAGASKPSKQFFDYLYRKIKNKNKETMIMIGDSLSSDILGGMNNGIDSCWFNPKNKALPCEYKPTIVINNLPQLKKKF